MSDHTPVPCTAASAPPMRSWRRLLPWLTRVEDRRRFRRPTTLLGRVRALVFPTSGARLVQGRPDRKAFSEAVSAELHYSVREGNPFTILWLSLEGIRAWEHQSGGREASTFEGRAGAVLRSLLRSSDTVYELSSGEFGIVLPGMDEAAAEERIRWLIEGLTPEVEGLLWPITVRVGGITWNGGDAAIADLLQRLYQTFYEARLDRNAAYRLVSIHHVPPPAAAGSAADGPALPAGAGMHR